MNPLSSPIYRITRDPRIRITRNGYHLAFVSGFTVMGSIVRDLNLLAVLSGLLIGVLIVQWRFSRGNLLGLCVSRRVPSEVFAGEDIIIRYKIKNLRRFLVASHLRFQENLSRSSDNRLVAKSAASLASLEIGEVNAARCSCRIMQRGQYRFDRLRVATEFPFGLTNTYCEFSIPETLTVYPRLGKLSANWRNLIAHQSGQISFSESSGSSEGDFYGIRGWQNGDSRRWIHWRTCARINDLAVRQFERLRRQQFAVLLDLQCRESQTRSFERLMSFTATVIHETLRQPHNELCMATTDGFFQSNLHRADFRRAVFRALAIANPQQESNLSESLSKLFETCDLQWPVLVLSLRGMPTDFYEKLPTHVARATNIYWINMADPRWRDLFVEARNAND